MTVKGGALPDQSLFLLGPRGQMKGLYWAIWAMREQYWKPWERCWSIPFPLDLKAQHRFWDQRPEAHPVGGPVVWRVVREWEEGLEEQNIAFHSA